MKKTIIMLWINRILGLFALIAMLIFINRGEETGMPYDERTYNLVLGIISFIPTWIFFSESEKISSKLKKLKGIKNEDDIKG